MQWYSSMQILPFHRVLVTMASHFLNFPPKTLHAISVLNANPCLSKSSCHDCKSFLGERQVSETQGLEASESDVEVSESGKKGKFPNPRAWKFPNPRAWKFPNTRASKFPNPRAWKFPAPGGKTSFRIRGPRAWKFPNPTLKFPNPGG